jgi:hypothetical protein
VFGRSKFGLGDKRVRTTVVVSAADVDGGLKGVEAGGDRRNDTVGDTIDA